MENLSQLQWEQIQNLIYSPIQFMDFGMQLRRSELLLLKVEAGVAKDFLGHLCFENLEREV